MSKIPSKPGLGAGKATGTAKGPGGPGGPGGSAKGNDPKHLPREFK
jgi:hypothetical protein